MRHIFILPFIALAACQPVPEDVAQGTCPADGYATLVGQPLAAVTLPADLDARIIGPDTVVTMDFDPTRMNIYVDEDGVIQRVACG
jgi:hypothetical protein